MNLTNAETYSLWVNSGGMCAICKRKLILDDIDKKINIGERAHIIGQGSKEGPRREYMEQYGLTEDTIDSLWNIVLLCETDHKIVDQNEKQYPPELLYKIKKEHEAYVQNRLDMYGKSIIAIHKRKGGPIDHIEIAGQIESVMVDSVTLQDEFTDFSRGGWEKAKKQNDEFYERLMDIKKKHEGASIAFFSVSPIPLLIHFGHLISDSVPIDVYQYNRAFQTWVRNTPTELPAHSMEVHVDLKTNNTNCLAVAIEVSGHIRSTDVSSAIGKTHDLLKISVPDPKIDAVLYSDDVLKIKKTFQDEILRLIQIKGYSEIHLFYFGPAGLALEIGRCINATMFPYVSLYQFNERDNPRHKFAFAI